ncbi:MAG TPA: response regulator transcription factor, partial [Pseudomonadales bacterium]|nr:response regulator transcription factor [Pseudomonadales bacterium]
MRVLLVEDNELLGDGLVTALKQEGYAVDWLRSGQVAVNAPFSETFDVIILDLGLPGVDGMSLLKDWRLRNLPTPVLILTARDSLTSRVDGLDGGADDFLGNPFERAELMARLRSILRRSHQVENSSSKIYFGDIVMDTASHDVTYKGQLVNISRLEFSLLHSLIEKPGKVFTREEIYYSVWGDNVVVGDRTIDVHIRKLREKIGDDYFKTIKGVG